jgi:hypothetical protein
MLTATYLDGPYAGYGLGGATENKSLQTAINRYAKAYGITGGFPIPVDGDLGLNTAGKIIWIVSQHIKEMDGFPGFLKSAIDLGCGAATILGGKCHELVNEIPSDLLQPILDAMKSQAGYLATAINLLAAKKEGGETPKPGTGPKPRPRISSLVATAHLVKAPTSATAPKPPKKDWYARPLPWVLIVGGLAALGGGTWYFTRKRA